MALYPYIPKLHSMTEVLNRINHALQIQQPLSLIRLGNGEALSLAHGVLISMSQIEPWLEYAGVKLPNEAVRQDLMTAVREASIVGLTTDTVHWDCAPLLQRVLRYYHLNPKYPTDAAVNWQLHQFDRLYQSLGNAPTIVVGRMASIAAPILRKKGVNIIAEYSLENYDFLDRTEQEIAAGPQYRVTLVAAGIPATILCPRLIKKANVIAIDYGHVINDLIKPGFSNKDLPEETLRWINKRTDS